MTVFSCPIVVGNLTTITAVVQVWWQYHHHTLFVLRVCAHPHNRAQAYTSSCSEQMWQCPMSTTCSFLPVIGRCFSRMVAILLHHLKFIMVWPMATNMYFPCALEAYNVVVHDDRLHWGRLRHALEPTVGNTNVRIACNMCCNNLVCSTAKHVTSHNNITYSFNMRYTFYLSHGHISQHALQWHHAHTIIVNTCYFCCTILEAQHNHKHGIILFFMSNF